MLLISDKDVFDVKVFFSQKDATVTFFDEGKEPADVLTETFTFRKPDWQDTKTINSVAFNIDSTTGKPNVDLYRYMDVKFKTLLKDWSLKDGENKVPVTGANINKLNPDLVQHLFTKLEEKLSATAPEVKG